VATCPPYSQHDIEDELRLVRQAVSLGVSPQRTSAADNTWTIWEQLCDSINIDPTLQTTANPIIQLQLFTHRYRGGTISPSKSVVRGKTVGDALRSIGQTTANMGYGDPRLLPSGKLNFCLSRQLSHYNKANPPPSRVKPIPCSVLAHTVQLHQLTYCPRSHAIADMLTFAFYFLLCPGEYAQTSNPESTPFRLIDVHLHRGQTRLLHLSCPFHELDSALFVCLEFTNQKNGVRGELIGLSRSGNPVFCPVQACINRVKHLRQHNAHPTSPLYTFFATCWQSITTTHITTELQAVINVLGHTIGLLPTNISVCSLCASGAMALLCANIDMDRIRLLGRWRSDEMLRYLHVQAHQVVVHIANAMLTNGDFHLIPNFQPQPGLQPAFGG
jgi:hypothetical protein